MPRTIAKTITKKVPAKTAKSALKTAPKKTTSKIVTKDISKPTGLSVKVFDMQGKNTGTLSLPKEIFGQTPNKKLLAQAIRVYEENEKPNFAHTKTRGEVRGGGVKPWRQKGTGRARSGSIRSPIWVGGGTTFGPRANFAHLSMPQKMRHKALIYALSTKAKAGEIKVISNIEKIEPKTKLIANLIKKLEVKKNVLLVISQKNENIKLASRNIKNIYLDTPSNLNAYKVLKLNEIFLSKESINNFK